ncbi:MAG TPA: hypothetical protein VI837_05320 [Blastocatellia bacterium]|nr:hypothetical protein [Blastocatellia bacterium]
MVFTKLRKDEQALALFKEQDGIWRTLGNWKGVSDALVEQMKSLSRMGRTRERTQLAEEADRLASLPGCWMPKIEIRGDVILQATTGSQREWWIVPPRTAATDQSRMYLPGRRFVWFCCLYAFLIAAGTGAIVCSSGRRWLALVGVLLALIGVVSITLLLLTNRGYVEAVACPTCGNLAIRLGKTRILCRKCLELPKNERSQ